MDEAAGENPILLANLPPSKAQVRLALLVLVCLLTAFAITVPFADSQLPQTPGFFLAVKTAIIINDLVTCALLFAQFSVVSRPALLALALGYLFSALIAIPAIAAFPGLLSAAGLLGAGYSSPGWLVTFSRVGSTLAIIVYVLVRSDKFGRSLRSWSPMRVIIASVAAISLIVCGLTWMATTGEAFLPRLMIDRVHMTQGNEFVGIFCGALDVVALGALWIRRRSVLDLWLMVLCCTWILQLAVTFLFIKARFSLGWYAGGLYELTATLVVLLVLLSEVTTLYANLARSVMRQRAARDAREIAMDAMVASIAHEIKQPLTAVAVQANAALQWLGRSEPELDEARASLERIAVDAHRANEVIGGIQQIFKKDIRGRTYFNVNDLVQAVLTMIDLDLRAQRVMVSTEFGEGLPPLHANRTQLQELFLNLIMNAVEAMQGVYSRSRLLRVSSEMDEKSSAISVRIEDSGTGIDEAAKGRIFEPFYSTKSSGTGIGLTICRLIVDAHGGNLSVSHNVPHGTTFQVVLPCTALARSIAEFSPGSIGASAQRS